MGYSTPMLKQYNKYNSTHNVSVSDNLTLIFKLFFLKIKFIDNSSVYFLN